MINPSDIVGTNEAAQLLGLKPNRVVVLCREGKLPGAWLFDGRHWAIPRETIEARLALNLKAGRPKKEKKMNELTEEYNPE